MYFRRGHRLWRYQKRFIETLARMIKVSEVDTKDGVLITIRGKDPNNAGSPLIEIKVGPTGEFLCILERTQLSIPNQPPHHTCTKFDVENGIYSTYEEYGLAHAHRPYRTWETRLMGRLRASDYLADIAPLAPAQK